MLQRSLYLLVFVVVFKLVDVFVREDLKKNVQNVVKVDNHCSLPYPIAPKTLFTPVFFDVCMKTVRVVTDWSLRMRSG